MKAWAGLVGPHRQHDLAAARAHAQQVTGAPVVALEFLRVHFNRRLAVVTEQAAERAAAAHAVPLVAQPAGGQREREARVARLGDRAVSRRDKAGAAVGRGEAAVFVKARAAGRCALGARPLLGRGFERGVGQAGDVNVAATRALAVFVPHGFGACVLKHRTPIGAAARQARLEPLRELDRDGPIGARLAGRGHGRANPADAALAVGERAFLLAPGGGGQQQVGVGRGGGGRKGCRR